MIRVRLMSSSTPQHASYALNLNTYMGVWQIEVKDWWMDILRLYVIFISISGISGRRKSDNERLCAVESRL